MVGSWVKFRENKSELRDNIAKFKVDFFIKNYYFFSNYSNVHKQGVNKMTNLLSKISGLKELHLNLM